MIQNHPNFMSVPKLKLANNPLPTKSNSQLRDSMTSMNQKQQLEAQQMMAKNNSPASFVRTGIKHNTGMFLTPKESTKQLNSPLQSSKGFLDSSTRPGAFSDYYNKECLKQPNRLPSITKSNSSNRFASQPVLPDDSNPRQKNSAFSSDVSNFDSSSTAMADTMAFKGGKSTFYKLKPNSPNQQLLARQDSNFSDTINNSSALSPGFPNTVAYAMSMSAAKKDQQTHHFSFAADSPKLIAETSAQLTKQQQIKALQDEQKKQQLLDNSTSPFPLRRKPFGRMSLNVHSLTDNNYLAIQKQVLNEQLGGETVFSSFVQNLIYTMKKVEFFEVFFEEYYDKADQIKFRISSFLMSVFTNNKSVIITAMQDFMNTFNTLTDSNIFELKAFLFEFLTSSNGSNNTFPDKTIAYKLIENLEVYRQELTDNEQDQQLLESSLNILSNNIADNLTAADFFSRFDKDKLIAFAQQLIYMIFNKISCSSFITEFEAIFQTNLIVAYLNILKDILRKSMSDLKEYSPIFRKNVSYQLRKVQWLLPSSSPTYISIISNASELLYPAISSILQQTDVPLVQQKAFIQLIKTCYSTYNVFNMTDTIELQDSQKDTDKPSSTPPSLCQIFKQALITSKIPSDTAKKIEMFTLSIFE